MNGIRLTVSSFDEREDPLELSGAVGEGDPMWNAADPGDYRESVRSCVRNVRLALLTVAAGDPARILDMASGFGRQTRALRAAYPNAEIAACDVHAPAIEFCAEHFGAIPVQSSPDLHGVTLPGPFDLIWCGSLLTHLPDWTPAFELLSEALAPRGVMVLTTAGRSAASRLRQRAALSALTDDEIDQLLAEFDATGFGFVSSPRARAAYIDGTYGATLASAGWACRFVEQFPLRVIGYVERGWQNYQDVLMCQRVRVV